MQKQLQTRRHTSFTRDYKTEMEICPQVQLCLNLFDTYVTQT